MPHGKGYFWGSSRLRSIVKHRILGGWVKEEAVQKQTDGPI